MSTLATIFVKQCDLCRQVIVLKTDIEFQAFQALWHEGFDLDFCIICRERDDVKRRIDSDDLRRQEVVDRVLKLSEKSKEAKSDYAH